MWAKRFSLIIYKQFVCFSNLNCGSVGMAVVRWLDSWFLWFLATCRSIPGQDTETWTLGCLNATACPQDFPMVINKVSIIKNDFNGAEYLVLSKMFWSIIFCNRVLFKRLSGAACQPSFWQGNSAQTDWLYQSLDTDAPANTEIASHVISLITQQLGRHCYTCTTTQNYFYWEGQINTALSWI